MTKKDSLSSGAWLRVKRFVDLDFLGVLLCLSLSNFVWLGDEFLPTHDALSPYYFFHGFYRNYFLYGELTHWLPFGFDGIQADYLQLMCLAPTQYLAMVIGSLLHVASSVKLYFFSIYLEQLIFLGGLYALATYLFRHRATRLLVCLLGIGTLFWAMQTWFNFRIYIYLPIVLLCLRKYVDENKPVFLWSGILATEISMLGMIPYTGVLYFFFFPFVFFVFWREKKSPRLLDLKIFSLRSLPITLGCFFLGLHYVAFLMGSLEYLQTMAVGRMVGSYKASAHTFLTYGVQSPQSMLELIYALPGDFNMTFYLGLIPLVLIALGVNRVKESMYGSLWLLTLVLVAFSWSFLSFLAPLLYNVPVMGIYRHIGYVLPLVKILMMLLAAYGMDYWLDQSRVSSEATEKSFRYFSFALIGGIVAIDLLRTPSPAPYKIPFFLSEILNPINVRYVAILTLGFLLVRLGNRRPVSGKGALICACVAFEIFSYQAYLHCALPVRRAFIPDETFEVRPLAFASKRRLKRAEGPNSRTIKLMTSRIGTTEAIIDDFLGVDTCERGLRRNFVNNGVELLTRARLGLTLNDRATFEMYELYYSGVQVGDFIPPLPPTDKPLWAAFGCDSDKLKIFRDPTYGKTTVDAFEFAKRTRDIDKKIILLNAEPPAPSAETARSVASETDDKIEVKDFRSNRLVAEVNVAGNSPAWLYYADAWNPNWRAQVNGQEVRVAQANLAFKAVPLTPGKNEVEFFHDGGPNAFFGKALMAWGVAASLLLLAGVAAVLFGKDYLRRRPENIL